ncbi:MAG: sulfate ABC transporter substrate-binding protein [Puniceicoccales bacterium]|nr:sulfate ABC transporter substrate-binding protein [Puniceicoccales bacterium]
MLPGAGDFGIDARWSNQRPPAAEEERVVAVQNAANTTARAFFAEINKTFGAAWVAKTDYSLSLGGAHGPTFAHTRSILVGQSEPDIVTFDNPAAIDELAAAGLLSANWRSRLPNNSVPFTTTLVFLVRKGNPAKVRDWSDLVRADVRAILPDPRSSSVGQWLYLAVWADALERTGGDAGRAREHVRALYRNAASLHSSANGAAGAFLRGKAAEGGRKGAVSHVVPAVLVLLESEARARRDAGEIPAEAYEIVTPPRSLRVDLPVAWLDKNTARHENTRVSASLLLYLFSPEGQEAAARHHFRPVDATVAAKVAARFAPVRLVSIDDVFGGWDATRRRFFAPGGELDREYKTLVTSGDATLDLAPRLPVRRRPGQAAPQAQSPTLPPTPSEQ